MVLSHCGLVKPWGVVTLDLHCPGNRFASVRCQSITKWWLIANWPHRNKLWIKTKICSLNALENAVCKMVTILCRPKYVHKVNIVENSKVEEDLFLDDILQKFFLTHWGRVTHICVAYIMIIASDNGLSPGWHTKPLSKPMLKCC